MTQFARLSSLALLALTTAASASCGKDPGNGNVIVSYEWNLGSACTDPFGTGTQPASEIRVTLTAGSEEIIETGSCDDGTITVASVPQGSYQVLVEALDETGDTIADNISIPKNADESVSVTEGSDSSVDAELAATPATIEVALQVFSADMFAVMCSESQIKTFEVEAKGMLIGTLHTAVLDFCMQASGFQPVPDEMRRVNGLVLNRVDIQAQDASGNGLQDIGPFTFPAIGAGKTVRINVQCVETDCTGTTSFPEGGGGGGDGATTSGGDDGMATTGDMETGGMDESSGGADSSGG